MNLTDGDIFNAGVIRLTANTIPYSAFANGSFSTFSLKGGDIQLTGGGVIDLVTADTSLGPNDYRPQFRLYSNGSEQVTANFERFLPSKLVNVDNTIRGGGYLGGNGEVVNGEAGVIESSFNTRLTLENYVFTLFTFGGFGQSQNEKSFITNHGLIRATSTSTLEIKFSTVWNADGEIRADGADSLVYLTSNAVVSGGITKTTDETANIFIEKASFVDGAVLDTRVGRDAQVFGFIGLIDAEIYGNLNFSPQDFVTGNNYGASFGGVIRNHDAIFTNDVQGKVQEFSVFRDTVFTGGGRLEITDFNDDGLIRLQGGQYEYQWSYGDPAPDAPPEVRLINQDNTFRLAGLFKPYFETRDFTVIDPVDGSFNDVARPLTSPLRIENLKDGVIESFLLTGASPEDPPIERRAVFQDMTIDNSGLVRTNNATGMEFVRSTVNNVWFDYDAATPGAPRTPFEGRLEGDFGALVLKESTVVGGELNVNFFGGLQVSRVDFDGDGVSHLAGVQMRVDNGSGGITIDAGAALRLGDRPLAGGGEEHAFIELRGELTIKANDQFGYGYGLLIGDASDGADVTIIGGGVGRITLATEAGAFENAGIRSVGQGGTLNLSDLTIGGWGDLADNGIDLSIWSAASVNLEATGDGIRIGANRTTIEADAALVDRSEGDIVFNGGLVLNQGLITIEDARGGFIFENTVQNDGVIRSAQNGTIEFRGDAVGAGRFELFQDSRFVFDGIFDGRLVLNPFEGDAPEHGTAVFNTLFGFNATIESFANGDALEFRDIAIADAQLSFVEVDNNQIEFTLQDNEDFITFRLDPGVYGSYDPFGFQIEDRGDGGTRFFHL